MKLLGCIIHRKGPSQSNSIAITFDDGPHNSNTRRIIEMFEQNNGHGTFFVTGEHISQSKNLVKEMTTQGHTIGNHTYTHCNAFLVSRKKLYDEISKTKELIENITGAQNKYFRPPFGIITPGLLSICRQVGLIVVLWSGNSLDFRNGPASSIAYRLRNAIRPGSILLFHECHFKKQHVNYSNTLSAMQNIITSSRQKKLNLITISEMFK